MKNIKLNQINEKSNHSLVKCFLKYAVAGPHNVLVWYLNENIIQIKGENPL